MAERKNPVRLLGPGWLSGKVYAVTSYKVIERDDGGVTIDARVKHDVDDDFNHMLMQMGPAEIKRRVAAAKALVAEIRAAGLGDGVPEP
jgi:hypothetical protein